MIPGTPPRRANASGDLFIYQTGLEMIGQVRAEGNQNHMIPLLRSTVMLQRGYPALYEGRLLEQPLRTTSRAKTPSNVGQRPVAQERDRRQILRLREPSMVTVGLGRQLVVGEPSMVTHHRMDLGL